MVQKKQLDAFHGTVDVATLQLRHGGDIVFEKYMYTGLLRIF